MVSPLSKRIGRAASARNACCSAGIFGKLRHMTPWGIWNYASRVAEQFTMTFTLLLGSSYVGVKGVLHGVMMRSMLPYYKSIGLDGIQYQTATAVARSPWAMKGMVGALSDGFPLFGYHKRPYMLMATALGVVGVVLLGVVPLSAVASMQWVPALLFMANQLQVATVDLLCEGKYAEKMSEKPHTGTDIVTFVWMCIMMGKLVASSLVGPIADAYGVGPIFWMAAPLALQVAVPLVLGYLPEDRLPKGQRNKPQWGKMVREKHYFIISTLMSLGAIALVIVALMTDPLGQFICALTVSGVLCVLSLLWMPRMMALCNLYMFLCDILHPSLGGAMEYWYTAEETCVVGGPGFSYTYYQTWSGLVGIVASLVGVAVFQTVMKNWSFRKAFWVTTGIRVVASLVDLMMVMRWNVAIGISDKVMYMLGDAIILDIVEMMNFMPSVVLISKLCPKDMESTVYAILAGFSNFGGTVSGSLGVYAMKIAGIDTKACNFDNLPLLVLVCHLLLPLLAVPLTFVMIPNTPMTASLQRQDNEGRETDLETGASSGSESVGSPSTDRMNDEEDDATVGEESDNQHAADATDGEVVA